MVFLLELVVIINEFMIIDFEIFSQKNTVFLAEMTNQPQNSLIGFRGTP